MDAVGPVIRGTLGDNFTFSGEINVTALFIGYNKLHVGLLDGRDNVSVQGFVKRRVRLQ